MAEAEPTSEEPSAQPAMWHPLYDVFGGAALLGMSAALGGASWHPGADALDFFFDGLAVTWLVAGVVRWVLRLRGPSVDGGPRGASSG